MARTRKDGTNGDDKLDIKFGFNDVFGLKGNDTIRLLEVGSLAGNNFVDAGAGNDTVISNSEGGNRIILGIGNDTYIGKGFDLGGTIDIVEAGEGDDTIFVTTLHSDYLGQSGKDTFVSVGFKNRFDGGDGIDTISYEARTDNTTSVGLTGVEIRLDFEQQQAFTGAQNIEFLFSIENARGSNNNDTIAGSELANLLEGLDGNDLIVGGGGKDVLKGGDGNDELQGGTSSDQLFGGSGNDRLFGESSSDRLDGGSGDDQLDGGSSGDTLIGGTGKDILFGGTGDDKLFGDSSTDTLDGGSDDDELHGGSSADILLGGSGSDVLFGDSSGDTLRGGTGKDRLTGGTGDDIFDFNSSLEASSLPQASRRDVITDFTRGEDVINLHTIDADSITTGNQNFKLRDGEHSTFTGIKGQLIWDKQGSGTAGVTIISGDTNGDKLADFQIELTGRMNMTEADFVL